MLSIREIPGLHGVLPASVEGTPGPESSEEDR